MTPAEQLIKDIKEAINKYCSVPDLEDHIIVIASTRPAGSHVALGTAFIENADVNEVSTVVFGSLKGHGLI